MTWSVRSNVYERKAKRWRRYPLDLMEIGSFAPTHGVVCPPSRASYVLLLLPIDLS
jgi:hypothetical protein